VSGAVFARDLAGGAAASRCRGETRRRDGKGLEEEAGVSVVGKTLTRSISERTTVVQDEP
jgi:hypothetical protein